MVLNWYTKPIYPLATGCKAFSGSFWQMEREQNLQSFPIFPLCKTLSEVKKQNKTEQIGKTKKESEDITESHTSDATMMITNEYD